jgi:hypothetical protein
MVGPRFPAASRHAGTRRARADDRHLTVRQAGVHLARADGSCFGAAVHSVELVFGQLEYAEYAEQQHGGHVPVLIAVQLYRKMKPS